MNHLFNMLFGWHIYNLLHMEMVLTLLLNHLWHMHHFPRVHAINWVTSIIWSYKLFSDSKFVCDKLLFSHWHWHFQKLLKCHVGSLEGSFHLPPCHFTTAVLYVLVGNTLLLHNLCIHLSEVTTNILVSPRTTLVTKGIRHLRQFCTISKIQQIFPKKNERKIHQVTVGTWTTSSCVIGTGTSTVCSTCSCLKFASQCSCRKRTSTVSPTEKNIIYNHIYICIYIYMYLNK